ncbi:MAG TPA: trypsin-like peptidase domain-containing protein [Vicinamibacterales bacterium]|nr:trypsin-like peptidase domain-containing protein [Vicinamibacterales bacterium]
MPSHLSSRFAAITIGLAMAVGAMIGLVLAGSLTPSPAHSAPGTGRVTATPTIKAVAPAGAASFADIADQLNPAVVTIDASARGSRYRRLGTGTAPEPSQDSLGRGGERERDGPRRGAGTGFLVDAEGFILTNHHVVDAAERIIVRLSDGRALRARVVGSDPDTDIALIKIDSPTPLPYARLGDSDTLRVGEWVVAIGNPLAYEHTVTVGVVSFIGRKLFDSSFDRYIQTDAAINLGNSGGPLINARGEVVGINAAVSSRATSIGFAVPINQAVAILPQLRETGRVTRGYIGVKLRTVDADLQRSLRLSSASGALVQDVAPGSPGERAGLRPYDVITAVDGATVSGDDELISTVARRQPGTSATLTLLRDGRIVTLPVKLAERPQRERATAADAPVPSGSRGSLLGLSVRSLDPDFVMRYHVPDSVRGVVVWRVDAVSPAIDADIERGDVILEIDRRPVRSVEEYDRAVAQARPGDVLAFYVYKPSVDERRLSTVRIDDAPPR